MQYWAKSNGLSPSFRARAQVPRPMGVSAVCPTYRLCKISHCHVEVIL